MTKDEALRLALEALEETWYHVGTFSPTDEAIELYDKAIRAIKEALETKDEPVATVISESGANVTHSWWHEPALPIGTKLYTTPQRTWVGLKDEDEIPWDGVDAKSFAKAIETKLKEKNT